MPERDVPSEGDQSGLDRRRGRIGAQTESLDRPPEQGRVAERFGRCDEQEEPGVGGQSFEASYEAVLDLAGERRTAEAVGELGRGPGAGEFEQGERIAPGLGDDPVADPRVDRSWQHRIQQGPRVGVAEAADLELVEPGQLVVQAVADGEHHHDRFRLQPPGDEREDPRGHQVEPLGVVDHAQDRALGCRVGEQVQYGEADEEPTRGRTLLLTERDPQRLVLRRRKPVQPVEERAAELVEPRVGELHLGLDTDDACDDAAVDARRQCIEQRRLADAGLATEHQGPATSLACGLEHPVQYGELVLPPPQFTIRHSIRFSPELPRRQTLREQPSRRAPPDRGPAAGRRTPIPARACPDREP